MDFPSRWVEIESAVAARRRCDCRGKYNGQGASRASSGSYEIGCDSVRNRRGALVGPAEHFDNNELTFLVTTPRQRPPSCMQTTTTSSLTLGDFPAAVWRATLANPKPLCATVLHHHFAVNDTLAALSS